MGNETKSISVAETARLIRPLLAKKFPGEAIRIVKVAIKEKEAIANG